MKLSFALGVILAFGNCAFADSNAWITTGTNQFGTVDLNTGSFTFISDVSTTLSGLGEVNNALYTGMFGGNTLYKINTATGAMTSIGTGSLSYFVLGSTNTGLYSVAADGTLWSIDPSTGASTAIGATNISIGNNDVGISTGSNALYLTVGSSLYSINTSTGAATLIGNTGSTQMGALTTMHGLLYATSITAPNSIFSLNSVTAQPTFIASPHGDVLPGYAWGLAPIVPEPGSMGMIGLGGLLVAAFLARRRFAQA